MDEVVTDRRKEYRKSESLPDLEIPPDLTLEADVDPLLIPNEEAATYTEYQRRRSLHATGAEGGAEIAALDDEQVVVLSGSTLDIWPRLRQFWTETSYELDLDDAELGVMETHWLETGNDGVSSSRDRISIIAEPGSQPDTTMLFISSVRQERLITADSEGSWNDAEKDVAFEREVAALIKQYFTGGGIVSTSAGSRSPAGGRAEIRNLSDDRMMLAMPDEYSMAWRLTGKALNQAGFVIQGEDEANGTYDILYFDQPKEEGMLSKLKFWGDDGSEGVPYQLSLTRSGGQTELMVLDENGDLAGPDEASHILAVLQSYYNSLRR